MFKLSAIVLHLKQMRSYIIFSFMVFFAGIIIGGTNSEFHAFLEGQLAGLGQLKGMVDQSANPTLTMMIVIFLNNAIKSILIMYLGAFFGLLPLLFLAVNGMIIGYLLQRISETPGSHTVLEVIFKGLLPHGIIEIPAIIIACAYGMKFGTLILRATGNLLFVRSKLGATGKDIGDFVTRTVPMIVILTVSLLVASIIESTFTVWLLSL
ncbi:stage II sporulation protein M [Paenibacillus sp. GSMTC-2017]|uniref:stage II sporulation protein M n=1 Tax=Paenibacillus sp. GSMTC-2017 TaxID=2794350 RepID=UPI0018D60B23|nr:stage II sporulation protein M [Paenibacillus sp. GSMTC-2017]MBH5320755.1 stage II sporulation protein M [Paenibacillus sp. GSMTC-2017]